MNITREEKKTEAIARMKMLGIFPETIKQFQRDDYVSISEPPVGAFFWAEGEDLQRIQEFEQEYNALVYVVVRWYTDSGVMDSYLYVSDYRDEWELECRELDDYEPYAYVYNHDAPECSEIGNIGIELTIAAGLRRAW